MSNLDEAIINPLDCNQIQLKAWLGQLSEYIKRDTPVTVTQIALSGQRKCPTCDALMAIGVKYFCDKCGQRIQ